MIDKLNVHKNVWVAIHLITILWISWMASGVINKAFVGFVATDLTSQSIKSSGKTLPFKPGVLGRDYSFIVSGNIFNSALVKTSQTVGRSPQQLTGIAPGVDGDGPKTGLKLKLVGTIWDRSGRHLLAAIQSDEAREQDMYRVGDEIQGATIVSIQRSKVGLMNNGRLETLEIDFSKSTGASQRGRPSIKPGRSGSGLDVMKQGDNDYVVSRRYVDSQLKNMNKMLTEVRAVPNMDKGGSTNGFRLFSIKKGSVFNKIGLRNHDVVQRINGVEINSAEKGLELFQALRNESSFEVDLLRKSQKTTLRFSIQ